MMKIFIGVFVFSLIVIVGMMGADDLEALDSHFTQVAPGGGDSSLAVVFGRPSEFDPVAGSSVLLVEPVNIENTESLRGNTFPESSFKIALNFAELDANNRVSTFDDPIPPVGPTNAALSSPSSSSGNAVPEPSTLFLVGLGLLGVAAFARRKS